MWFRQMAQFSGRGIKSAYVQHIPALDWAGKVWKCELIDVVG